MTLFQILVFIAAALLYAVLLQGRWRGWFLLGLSLLALFWLQPSTPIRHLDFWLAAASIILTIWVWSVAGKETGETHRATWVTAAAAAGLVLLVGLLRYLGPLCCLTASRPPDILEVGLGLALSGAAAWLFWRFGRGKAAALSGLTFLLLAVFVVLKSETLAFAASLGLRGLTGQTASLASAVDIRWLGLSYIAFRLLHVLRDRQSGKTLDLSLQEFIVYVLFFAALPAGPIDRAPRFAQDLRKPFKLTSAGLLAGGERLVFGVFKKFILADTLALIALNDASASLADSTSWLWVLLYAYALRIYLDFSGYTDIAIGLGLLVGIQLPENFDQPYLKTNLTTFWNAWHITLSQWFRAYFFNPVTRALRTSKTPYPMPLIILIGQAGTMLLIGLWHGITWNFILWGLWHAVGLFVHNRWSEAMRLRLAGRVISPLGQRLLTFSGTLLTFHFTALGWVWFALSSPASSWHVFASLFGLG